MASDVETLKQRVGELETLAAPLRWKRRARAVGLVFLGAMLVLAVDLVSPFRILGRRGDRYRIALAEVRNRPACWRLDRNTGELTLSVYDDGYVRTKRAIAAPEGISW